MPINTATPIPNFFTVAVRWGGESFSTGEGFSMNEPFWFAYWSSQTDLERIETYFDDDFFHRLYFAADDLLCHMSVFGEQHGKHAGVDIRAARVRHRAGGSR